ncbi:MAG: SMC-Scp complex subunit ScpB [bacterium]
MSRENGEASHKQNGHVENGAPVKQNGSSGTATQGTDDLKSEVEAALFVSEEPLRAADLSDLLDVDGNEIRSIMKELKKEYDRENRGIQLLKISGGFKMTTRERHYDFLKKMFGERTLPRLSDSAVETLVIVAYHQPIIRQEVESIRGVNCQSTLKTLMEKDFIRMAGRRDEIGRPIVYRTTNRFLDYFGLNSIDELPDRDEIDELIGEQSA